MRRWFLMLAALTVVGFMIHIGGKDGFQAALEIVRLLLTGEAQ